MVITFQQALKVLRDCSAVKTEEGDLILPEILYGDGNVMEGAFMGVCSDPMADDWSIGLGNEVGPFELDGDLMTIRYNDPQGDLTEEMLTILVPLKNATDLL